MAELNADLKLAFDTLAEKRRVYDPYFDYYAGRHPLVYSAARLRKVFKGLDANFVENWCSVVVNVPWERLVLTRLVVTDDAAATERLDELWARLDLNLDADEVHRAALIASESFVIAWGEPDDERRATSYYHDPRLCHVFYEDEDPRTARMAAKWWQEGKRYRLTLYYPDRLERYATTGMEQAPSSAIAFQLLDEPSDNPYGSIPVFRWTTGQGSALDNAIPIQASINKLLSDEMISAEFGAFRQRWIISQADPGALKNAPNEIWAIPAGDGQGQQTSVGEFGETSLGNYESAIERRIAALSSITRIPAHYFFKTGGQPPSGEALIVMEAPLNKMIERIIQRFRVTWQQYAAFLLKIEGIEIDPETVEPIYDNPQTVQPRTEAEIRQLDVAAGIPLTTELRREGWTEDELEQMQADRRAERDETLLSTSNLGGMLLEGFERGV